MSESIGKYLVWGNLLAVVAIYSWAALAADKTLMTFHLSTLQVVANLALAILANLAHLVTRFRHERLGSMVRGFWLSAVLVLVISFPTCLWVDSLHPYTP
ncbi:MAG: hypothetical protein EBV03_09440 [Proteobacteria bacterium]|nr:hypothetical protein [Pseudomonadota bacterium]